jgi:hypothetical protein
MVQRKIQDETELRRWYEAGVTYEEMAARYLEKYNLEVKPSMFSSWRSRMGLPKRIVRDEDLIPWEVRPEHRYNHNVNMLRIEARRRRGIEISELEASRLEGWKRRLEEDGAVIHYDPDTEKGFHRVARSKGDHELIHPPKKKTTRMPDLT